MRSRPCSASARLACATLVRASRTPSADPSYTTPGGTNSAGEPRFPDLAAIAMVEAEVERSGKTTLARRYYLSSALLDALSFARAVRAHWGIENRLHWVMDVVFHDDLARLRTGYGPENMAIVKHMAMNLARQAPPTTSLKNRRKLAGWDLSYLETLIRQTA